MNVKMDSITTEKSPTYGEIWKTLSVIDVGEHKKQKGNMAYLSWVWAWGVLMEKYPDAHYFFPEPFEHPDGSVTVTCAVSIGDCCRGMWLPVMDNKGFAIKNPDARKISDAKMRCLVKTLAMFGLGHYIYAGEDFPSSLEEQTAGADEYISDKEAADLAALADEVGAIIPAFLKHFGATSFETFPTKRHKDAVSALIQKRNSK